ncbi:hypothetical protein [Rhodococcus aetherivorans]|uniref:hypothetical protein n=1 Tax=Rhodococcus aetherivorans TaxID=191292 RepID=UPI001E3FBF1E|nr:hypothetical protein [Rhodococcus aetherivorans]UGQ41882.1 hypothetical protein LRQ66_00650 [Rhodococcus aetherivorans]
MTDEPVVEPAEDRTPTADHVERPGALSTAGLKSTAEAGVEPGGDDTLPDKVAEPSRVPVGAPGQSESDKTVLERPAGTARTTGHTQASRTGDTPDLTETPKPARKAPIRRSLRDVRSIRDYLQFLVDRKGPMKPDELKIGTAARRVLLDDPAHIDDLTDAIQHVSENDATLKHAVSLLAVADASHLAPRTRNLFIAIAARLLTIHPALASTPALIGPLTRLTVPTGENGDVVRIDDQHLDTLLSSVHESIESYDPEGEVAQKSWKTHKRTAVKNATIAVLYLAALEGEWHTRRLVHELATHFWPPSVTPEDDRTDRAALLTERPDVDALVAVAAAFERALDRAQTELGRERDAGEIAAAEAQRLAGLLTQAQERCVNLDRELHQARTELQHERERAHIEQAHLADDHESLKEELAPLLSRQIEALEDALDALRRNRNHITDEYLERALVALRHGKDLLYSDDSNPN